MTRVVLLVAMLTIGCQTEKKAQTASLIAAVERFQRGENADRPALAEEVAQVTCTDREVVPACAACVDATRSMGQAIRKKAEVETALDRLEAGTLPREEAISLHLDQKLDEAQGLLDRARAAMPTCEERLNALRR